MTTSSPTEVLKEEHQAVLVKLDDLEDIIHNLEERERIAGKLKELTAFFDKDFWVHFDKEERALFPEFDSFIPRGGGPIEVMLQEHEVLRSTNTVMQKAVAGYLGDSNDAETRRKITESGGHFIETLRNHINKEDSILFMMAEMHLDEGQMKRVLERFEEIGAEGARTPDATGKQAR